MPHKTRREVIRIAGKLKEVVTVLDEKGTILHKMINPLMVEFYARDLMQIMIGASILAVPVAYTEEAWNLGESLPFVNILTIMALSLVFISIFVYYNFYRARLNEHRFEFVKRVASIYLVSFAIVGILLTLIERAPWNTDVMLAFKRIVLVSFPASMSAAISDMIK